MNTRQIALLLATVLFAATAYAGDNEHHKMRIEVVSDDGDGETRLTLDSDKLGFKLRDMQLGENRSVVDEEGRTVLITRLEDGYAFDVDGKTINMPLPGNHGEHHGNVDVRVVHDGMPHKAMMDGEGVVIISGKEIDAATQEIIRNALTAAGHEEVHFADGHKGGPHQVRVVREVVEVEE